MKTFRLYLLGLCCVAAWAGCGDSVEVNDPITPVARIATYAVGADRNGGIDVFAVGNNGQLTAVAGSPFATGSGTNAVAVHPSGRFLFAGSNDAAVLEGFALIPQTGQLIALPGFPFATVADGNPVFDPEGDALYVIGDDDIDAFAVDVVTGGLVRLPGFPALVPGMVDASVADFSNNGNFLYIADPGSDSIFAFARNAQTGGLTLIAQQPSGGDAPSGLGVDESGNYLYAANQDGTLRGFSIGANGALTPLANGTTVYAATPSLTYTLGFREGVLFVGDAISGQLNAFAVGANGTLTQLPGYPRDGGGAGVLVYPLPLTDLIYSTERNSNQINGYVVSNGSVLTPVPGSPFSGTGAPTELEAAVVAF